MNLLPDVAELVKIIRKAALQSIKTEKLVEIRYGKVTDVCPLKVLVEQKLTLEEEELILTRNVTDYKTKISKINEKIEITVHNALDVGDKVILIRQQKGQKFVVLDRIGG